MSEYRTYKLLARITAFWMIHLVILASTGFTYSIHYCHGTVTQVSILPEMVPSSLPCSCDIDRSSHESQQNQGIGKASCCKNLHFFQRVNVLSLSNVIKDVLTLTTDKFIIINPDVLRPALLTEPISVPDTQYLSPRAGSLLVIAYHQIRIPSPSSDC